VIKHNKEWERILGYTQIYKKNIIQIEQQMKKKTDKQVRYRNGNGGKAGNRK